MFSPDCPGSLEVVHTSLRREDIPDELIQGLQERTSTDRPVRVVWFDGFVRYAGRWLASNVRDKVLRTKDFLDWYGGDDMTPEGWIRPGGTASCRVNWHYTQTPDGAPTKWAYVAVDAQGYDFFAEAVVPDLAPIRLDSAREK
jgi:hypothetical protein